MRKANKTAVIVAAGTILTAGIGVGVARADLFGSVLKGAAVAILIKQFSSQINAGLNKITDSAGAPITEATKVVPIISAGQGTYVGAAQVSGAQAQINQVQAVGMLETGFNGNQFRLKALVPVNTPNLKGKSKLSRIKGVGVSAIIDIHI